MHWVLRRAVRSLSKRKKHSFQMLRGRFSQRWVAQDLPKNEWVRSMSRVVWRGKLELSLGRGGKNLHEEFLQLWFHGFCLHLSTRLGQGCHVLWSSSTIYRSTPDLHRCNFDTGCDVLHWPDVFILRRREGLQVVQGGLESGKSVLYWSPAWIWLSPNVPT